MNLNLFASLERDIALWLAITIVLGGAGAMATGRALALAWRPASRLVGYMLILSAFTCFLCWALFEVPIIPARRIAARALQGDWGEVLFALSGLWISFGLLILMGGAAFALTRARQMRRQYPFLAP